MAGKEIHPLAIGNVNLTNNLILAPMAGVTDLPFRLLCKEQGAGLLCMEMVSAKAIWFGNRNTEKLMETLPAEQPVSLQLFGSDPDILAEIVARLQDGPHAILDFNMGCPVPKVVNNGEGSALMKDPGLVEEILTKMVKASQKKPVTVKIRRGFDEDHVNAVEIARIAEACGAAAIAVHGRTRQQYYSGRADWNIIRQVKEAVQIPVIGNGDLTGAGDVARMYEETGCDGFMVGRASRGNPWIFREILSRPDGDETDHAGGTNPAGRPGHTGGNSPAGRPGRDEICSMILRHAAMLIEAKGTYIGIREMRKHAAWYTAGLRNASHIRGQINQVESLEDLQGLLETLRKE